MIDTGYCANPNTGVTADFAFTSATPTQQKVFGADVDNGQDPDNRCFSFSTYINGSGYYAWACKDGVGNWTPYDSNNSNSEAKADTRRRTVVLDSYNKVATLLTGGEVTATRAISTTRTRTSPRTLAIFADNDGDKFTHDGALVDAELWRLGGAIPEPNAAKAVVTAALLHQWQTPPEPVPPSGRRIVRVDTQGNM